jgi:hypothetical protein
MYTTGPNSVSVVQDAGCSTAGGVLFGHQAADDQPHRWRNWTPALCVGTDGKLRGQFNNPARHHDRYGERRRVAS